MRIYIFLALVCSLNSLPLHAQQTLDSLRVSLQSGEIPIAESLNELNKKYNITFFAKPSDLVGNTPPLALTNEMLPTALDRIFKNSAMGCIIFGNSGVAVLPKELINTNLSLDYYKAQLARAEANNDKPTGLAVIESLVIGSPDKINPKGRAEVRLKVKDAQTGEAIAGAAVVFPNLQGKNATTDADGICSRQLPTAKHTIKVQYLGYEVYENDIALWDNGEITIALQPQSNFLSEILVRAEAADANVAKAQIGVTKLDPKAIKKLPTLLGEADVVRSLLTTTGVTTVGEGASGFNVRGGETDQNLTLQGEMILFNTSHALGFFSTYNTDLISKVDLYKSIIPAEYGGRLASVLDVQLTEGNFEKWRFKSGIGVVSARVGLEGPIKKNKTALSFGIRTSYSDWVLKLFKQPEVRNSSASFNDGNFGITHRFNSKNIVTIGLYRAQDAFSYNRQFGFDYTTIGGQLAYKHTFSERLFSRLSVAHSRYDSEQSNQIGAQAATFSTGIDYTKVKEVLRYKAHKKLQWDSGIEALHYTVSPGDQQPFGNQSVVNVRKLEKEYGLEMGVFSQAEWNPSIPLTLIGGLRLNYFANLGPKTVYRYNGTPSIGTLVDSTRFGKNEASARYWAFEPRFSLRYRLTAQDAVKAGYSRTSQFVNQIFNTDTPTPSSQYQLSTRYIPPFRAHNLAAGYFRNSKDNIWEMSGELFYRAIDQLWDYRDFARLIANDKLETEIRTGIGRAYGLELSAKTTRPLLNGQVGYTYSRAQRKVQGINKGRWYASNFDKPHILNLIVNYQPNQRNTVTFNFTYSTGRPTTAPLSSYRFDNNIIVPIYTPRNQARIPDYHRLDVAYTIGRGYNKKNTLKTSWNISVYNVYARRNAFSVFFTQSPDLRPQANRLAILGTIFPALTLNIETI